MIFLYRLLILSLIGFVFCFEYGLSITGPPPYNADFLLSLNNIPTVKAISFTSVEIAELKTSNVNVNTMFKFKNKMTDIKCIYGDVLKNVIIKMKETKNKSELLAIVKESKVYLSQMFSVLFMGKTTVANWLWDLFMLLEGIEKNPGDQRIFLSNIDSIKKSNENFVLECYAKGYLLKDCSIKKDTVPTLKTVEDMVVILKLDNNENVVKKAHQLSNRFDANSIVMNKLTDKLNDIKPTVVIEEDVWKTIAVKLNGVWSKSIENWYDIHYTIIENHHNLIANIVKMGVIYNVWMPLRILHNSTCNLPAYQKISNDSLCRYWRNLLEPVNKVKQTLGTLLDDNQFFKDLHAALKEPNYVQIKTLKKLMDSAKKEFYETFKATYGLKATEEKMTKIEKNVESIIIDDKIEIPYNASKYIVDLHNYSCSLEQKFDVTDFKLMQFYKLSKSNNWINDFEINN